MEMDVKKHKVDANHVKLEVSVPSSEMSERFEMACRAIAYRERLVIPAEEDAFEGLCARLGTKEAQTAVNNLLMNVLAPFAISAKKVECIGQFENFARCDAAPDKPFQFSSTVVLKPHYKLGIYDAVTVEMPDASVTDGDIDLRLEEIAQTYATLAEDTSHDEVQLEDELELKLEVFENGERFENMCFEKRPYQVGIGLMPESFDDGILGMKLGETREFDFSAPTYEFDENGEPTYSEYHAIATVLRLTQLVSPTITDAWVEARMPKVGTLEALRAKIRGELEGELAKERARAVEYYCTDKLAERITDPIPDCVYEANYAQLIESFQQSLAQQGMSLQDYLAQQGMEQQTFNMQMMLTNRTQLRQQFALDALADHLGVKVTPEALDACFEEMAPGHAAEARANFEEAGTMYVAAEAARRMLASKWLVEHSTVKFVPAPRP